MTPRIQCESHRAVKIARTDIIWLTNCSEREKRAQNLRIMYPPKSYGHTYYQRRPALDYRRSTKFFGKALEILSILGDNFPRELMKENCASRWS